MPDLGKYAFEVLLSYGLSLCCLAILILQSIYQSRKIKRDLHLEEKASRERD